MADKVRRHPLHKEYFLEGNRQKWVAVGLLITVAVLVCNMLDHIDPAPYLQSVMLLIGAGVLGWSVDSAVKAYKVDSSTAYQNTNTTSNSVSDTTNTNVTRTEVEEKLLKVEHLDPKDVPGADQVE